MNPVSLFPARQAGPTGALDNTRRDLETRPDGPRFELPEITETKAKPSERRVSVNRPEHGLERAELARHHTDEPDEVTQDAEHEDPPEPRPELVVVPLPDMLGTVVESEGAPLARAPSKGDADPDTQPKAERAAKPEGARDTDARMAEPRVARPDDTRATQPATQQSAQAQPAQPTQAQGQAQGHVVLPVAQALAEVVLDEQAIKKALQPVAPEAVDMVEVPTALDDLGLSFTERVLGVAHTLAPSAPHSQVRADIAGDVAQAVHKLLAEAADDQSLLRFRTEGGQTFIVQTRVDANGMELRLLSEDPAVRAMLQQRLDDLRTALHRVGFGDAQVQVDRDHTGADRSPWQHQESPEPDDHAPTPKTRHLFASPDATPPGRLHLIL